MGRPICVTALGVLIKRNIRTTISPILLEIVMAGRTVTVGEGNRSKRRNFAKLTAL